MESTSRDFWKMVYERECAVVVMLSAVEEEGQVGWMLGSTPYRALGEILTQNLINPSPTNILCWLYGLWFIKLFLMVGEGSKWAKGCLSLALPVEKDYRFCGTQIKEILA